MIGLIEQFAKEFGREDSEVFFSGVIQAIEKNDDVNYLLLKC